MSTIGRRDRGFGTVDTEYAMVLSTLPAEDDGPVWMVNLMKYRDRAEYTDGRKTTLSGREADDVYAPVEILADLGAEVAFFGDVTEHLACDEHTWDRVGVVMYPTRRSFIDMQARPDFAEKYAHKEAGMAETIIVGTQPVAAPTSTEAPADDPIIVVDVITFAEGADRAVLVPQGAHVAGWFDAEGTIIGDGRSWDQVRYHVYPNRESIPVMVEDPAVADRYSMIVRPLINRIAEYRPDEAN